MIDRERFKKRGRTILVGEVIWRFKVGKQSVIAYSEHGERLCEHCYVLKGLHSPDIYDRGQWKKTSDGMITPKDVHTWIKGSCK